jgi:hypothetical protein
VSVRFVRPAENEPSTTPFLLSHFSPGDKIENCSAQFLAVCWIVRVEFKVHRPPAGRQKPGSSSAALSVIGLILLMNLSASPKVILAETSPLPLLTRSRCSLSGYAVMRRLE